MLRLAVNNVLYLQEEAKTLKVIMHDGAAIQKLGAIAEALAIGFIKVAVKFKATR